MGDLLIEPKLMAEQFDQDRVTSVHTSFADRKLKITFVNEKYLSYGDYAVKNVDVNGEPYALRASESTIRFPREFIENLPNQSDLVVYLTEKP